MAELLQKDPGPKKALEFPSTRAKRLDRESLVAAGITLDQVARVRQQIEEVQEGQDTEEIRQFLVEVTMPMWVRRARERRDNRRRSWLFL